MKKLVALFLVGLSSLLFAADSPPNSYQASSKSTIYHLPSCTWAKKISKENLLVFTSKEAAEKKGYRACKVCEPDVKSETGKKEPNQTSEPTAPSGRGSP